MQFSIININIQKCRYRCVYLEQLCVVFTKAFQIIIYKNYQNNIKLKQTRQKSHQFVKKRISYVEKLKTQLLKFFLYVIFTFKKNDVKRLFRNSFKKN